MSIREPSSATSRRPRLRRGAGLGATIAAALGLTALGGCLVTDTIEFEDEVNRALEIVSSSPLEQIIETCPDDELAFEVTVRDPDEPDPLDSSIEALLSINLDVNGLEPPVELSCDPPRSPLGSEDAEEPEHGGLANLRCAVDLSRLNVPSEALLPVTVRVSDLGFTSAKTPRQGAHVVEREWVLSIEESSCE
jgi:hypothetical protein